jgi:speckle-type POZ protein
MAHAGSRTKMLVSASTILAARATGRHLLTIDGYSCTKDLPTGKSLQLRQFTVAGHRWHINYYPNGESSEFADYISLFLLLDGDDNMEVKAQHVFRVVDKVEAEEQAPSLTSADVKTFTGQSGW